MGWFFFNGCHLALIIKADNTIMFGILDLIGKDSRSLFKSCGSLKLISQAMTEKDIIPEDKADIVPTDKFAANDEGGAVFCADSSAATIIDNVFTSNQGNDGGAIYCSDGSNLFINDNYFDANMSNNGGSIASQYGADPRISDNVFTGNTALDNDEISPISGSNANVSYSDVDGGWPGTGNIDVAPRFANPDSGNFHIHWGSPCIDSGDPSYPLDSDETVADMGAFYFDQTVTPSIELFLQREPREIPIEGGEIIFDAWVYNLVNVLVTGDIWTYVFLPSGARLGPIDSYLNVTLPPDGKICLNKIKKDDRGIAAAGEYTLAGYVGELPNAVVDSSTCTFTKDLP